MAKSVAVLGTGIMGLPMARNLASAGLEVNAWIQSLTAAVGQSIALAEGLGVEPSTFLEVIDGTPTGSPYAQLKGSQILEGRLDDVSFSTVLARKDTGLVVEALEEAGLEAGLAQAVWERFDGAVRLGSGELDMAAVYHAFRSAE